MRVARIPLEARRLHRTRQHRLAEGEPAEGRGVEGRERVEGIALERGPLDRGVEERQVERGVVPDQHRPGAPMGPYRPSHRIEHEPQRFAFGLGVAQRVIGDDSVELQRRRLDVGVRERFDVGGMGGFNTPPALVVDPQKHHRDLEQRIGRGIESAGLDIHHRGEIPAKAARDALRLRAHVTRRHATRSPARNGTSTSSPIGISPGTDHGSLRSVMVSRFGASP